MQTLLTTPTSSARLLALLSIYLILSACSGGGGSSTTAATPSPATSSSSSSNSSSSATSSAASSSSSNGTQGVVTAASLSLADVQTAINNANSGDTVQLPAGQVSWTGSLSLSKGIHLRGAGSGRILGISSPAQTIGLGSKSISTQAGLAITVGQSLRVEATGATDNFMQGSVQSYTGSDLVLNVSQTGGSGARSLWMISTPPATRIVHQAGAAHLINIQESVTHSIEISGIQFFGGSSSSNAVINFNAITSGKPILIHDNWFRSNQGDLIRTTANRGIIYRNSFDSSPFSMAPLAIHQANASLGDVSSNDAWTTVSTMGMADTQGMRNLYIEDNDFHAFANATDMDSNARTVFRYNLMNHAGFGTHGADTSPTGVRHYEVYNNEFVFNNVGADTFNLNWWFYLRGGTGVIADNIMPDISSQTWGNKAEINMTIMNLGRNAGPNPCWGASISGIQAAAPRQIGQGYVTGTAGNDSVTYRGDLEPLYIWNNIGGYAIGFSDYTSGGCSDQDATADYLIAGRDFYNNGTAKPGYVKYSYPHPLRN